MKSLRTFADVREALAEYYDPAKPHIRVYTLDDMYTLLDMLDNPQNKLRIIHVAGTSGKTSTAYYAAALVHGAGFKVGLTVSPHVVEINDRVQINGVPLPEALFCSEIQVFLERVAAAGLRPSYFELMMAFAFWEFNRQQVDCAVVEVGLGGTLDASNTISRKDKICVLTDIGLDHTQVLGDTHGEIAAQKAGIIGFRNRVFCFQQRKEVMDVFRRQAQNKQADLHVLGAGERTPAAAQLPSFQQRNFTLALAAASEFCDSMYRPLTQKALEQAALTHIPGRMETKVIDGKTIIIDGAHNQQKLQALIDSIAAKYPGKRLAAVVAFGRQPESERRIREGLTVLRPFVDTLIVTSFASAEDAPHVGVPVDEVATLANELHFPDIQKVSNPELAFQALKTTKQPIGLVAGSFYLLNHVRPLLLARLPKS